MNTTRMVCFDWGGVILRHCRGWAQACAVAGLPIHDGILEPDLMARRRPINTDYQCGRIDCETFLARLASAVEGKYTREQLVLLHDRWLLDEYPGVDAVIARLVATPGVDTGLLSNTNHRHWQRHKDFPTASRLKHKHASHLLGLVKPDAAIYRAFETATGFRGAEILFFDDLQENLDAAAALGWKIALIDHTGDTAAQIERHLRAHRVF